MTNVLRVLLWALVLIAPGGILLAPFLAGYEMRRRSARRAAESADVANAVDSQRTSSVVAVASAR